MMKTKNVIKTSLFILLLLLVFPLSCGGKKVEEDVATLGFKLRRGFNAERAFRDLVRQVEFGPRVPGTEPHRKTVEYIKSQLELLGWQVKEQRFTERLGGQDVELINIIARQKGFDPKARRVILAAHYDTRPRAERDPDPRKRDNPIPGANDGASGVAALLEIGRMFATDPPPIEVEMVFFDAEDYGPYIDRMLLGSSYYAASLTEQDLEVIEFGVLLDMICDRDLSIPPEAYSVEAAPDIWAWALEVHDELGFGFMPRSGRVRVLDDHVPLIRRGVKMIDLIDFSYPWWHTTQDTPDKCSAESLREVGLVAANMVYGAKVR